MDRRSGQGIDSGYCGGRLGGGCHHRCRGVDRRGTVFMLRRVAGIVEGIFQLVHGIPIFQL